MKQVFNITLLALLIALFALPILAQESTEPSPTAETLVTETPVVVEAPENVGTDYNFIADILTLIGEAVNSYPGGFLSAAIAFVFLQRFSNNPKIIDVLERQFDNATRSYPPETINLLRERMQGFGGALVDIGKTVSEIGDGVPYNTKTVNISQGNVSPEVAKALLDEINKNS